MLLTSSQVSILISAGVIFVFTFALFLSGYVLQQQTVRGLQAIIKPNLPTGVPAGYVAADTQFRLGRGSVFDEAEYVETTASGDTVSVTFAGGEDGDEDEAWYDEEGNGGFTEMEIGVRVGHSAEM